VQKYVLVPLGWHFAQAKLFHECSSPTDGCEKAHDTPGLRWHVEQTPV
jgi:hypothetical protein